MVNVSLGYARYGWGVQELRWQRAMLSPNVVIYGLLGALVVSVNTRNVLFCMFLQPTNK